MPMPQADVPILRGYIVEEETVLTITDLSRLCAADTEIIVSMVEEGILHVMQPVASAADRDAAEWRFSGHALRRARIALRLQRDLEINLAGVALALDLMEEIEQLRRQRIFDRR